jgi:2-amino-4-hydroxy-6-hydroxymethyldihydropteridine diphosphokinase
VDGFRAAIALGSNIGDSCAVLHSALAQLDAMPEITVQARSHFYQTVAIGPPQPDVLNACAVLSTQLEPRSLLDTMLQIEAQFGRVRQERWGPRSLDLDLLLFEDRHINEPGLEVPHPRMNERAFVLVPLADVAPDWIEPVSGKAIAELLKAVDCSGVVKRLEC